MLLINDNENGDVFLPEDIFEEIAENILTSFQDRNGVGKVLNNIEPETHIEIVEETANIIHKGITEFVDVNFLKDVKEDLIITASCSVAKAELKKLFQRNMDNAAAS